MKVPLEYDKNLWFEHLGCTGKHFLIGNPHTYPGRMWAWCPVKNGTIFVSKADIGRVSKATEYWVKGFLSGNQPEPPVNSDGDVDYNSKSYKNWEKKVKQFGQTGVWKR